MSKLDDLPLIERLRIVPIAEAARLSGISEDGLLRYYRHKIIKLSPRRLGMRQGDALMLENTPRQASKRKNGR